LKAVFNSPERVTDLQLEVQWWGCHLLPSGRRRLGRP